MDGGPRQESAVPSGEPLGTTHDADIWRRASAHFRAWRDGGDRARFDDLVRVLTPALWHVVRAAGADEEQTRDVLQTVWLGLLGDPRRVRDADAVGKWLVVSARRESWRVVGRDRKVTLLDPTSVPELSSGCSTETAVVDASDSEILWRQVGAQSERCQRLLRVVACLDTTDYRTLAGDLGLAVGSIGATRRRCLDALKESLTHEGWSHV
ncbi:MAG: sigma-70 family RNA polymerase sigma factor [Rhodococcus sp. (in: high G+C Gram-positive bacteria)]